MFNLVRSVWSSVWVSLMLTLFVRESSRVHSLLVEHITPYSHALRMAVEAGGMDPASQHGLALIQRQIELQAAMAGYNAVFLLLAAPWFIAVSLRNPEFARFFFIQEHFERFTSDVHQRTAPAWFFLAVLALGFLPLLLPVLAAWWRGLRSKAPPFDASFFLALWALVVVVFFSASSGRSFTKPLMAAMRTVGSAIRLAVTRSPMACTL